MHGRWNLAAMALASLVLVSCGGKGEAPTASEGAGKILAMDEGSGFMALKKKFANYDKDVVVDEEGRIQKDSKRSSFESQQLTNIGGDYGKKQFAASRYSKKNWQGSRNFDPAKFKSSKNRWDNEEWFVQKQAREAGNAARAQNESFATGDYRTASAREQGGRRLSRGSDVETDVRRRVYQEPLIMEKEDYEKLSLDEAKGLLGR